MIQLHNSRYSVAYRLIKKELQEHGVECYTAEARWMMNHLGLPLETLLLFDGTLAPKQAEQLETMVERRIKGEPVQYILGSAGFMGLSIQVAPGVLIPRPETENLTEEALKRLKKGAVVLDLCCGSGCIGIALAKLGGAQVLCAEVEEICLEVTRKNAQENGVEERVQLQKSDLFNAIDGSFDLITCNPPYIPTEDIATLEREVRDYEPHKALDGGLDGLDFYRRIATDAARHLKREGTLFLEVGFDQAGSVAELLSDYKKVEIIKDTRGVERIVAATL